MNIPAKNHSTYPNPPYTHPKTALYSRVVQALHPIDPRGLLFRTTEGYNEAVLKQFGTDRHGRPEKNMQWHALGYFGPQRRWSEVIYATDHAQMLQGLQQIPGAVPICLDKLPHTPGGLVVVYRASCFMSVRQREYAIKPQESWNRALVAVFRVLPFARLH